MIRWPTVLALAAASCTVGPDHEPPERATPPSWEVPSGAGLSSDPYELTRWWRAFGDDVLTRLVERARRASPDLTAAASRVFEARYRRAVATGELGPDLDGTASFERSRLSQNSSFGSFIPGDRNLWSLGFDASWELDVFGGLRRAAEAADAEVGASLEDYRDVLVTLTAEVARTYTEYRGLQRRLAIARRNREAQAGTLGLVRSRFDAGLTGGLDVAQAELNLATTESAIPPLRTALVAARNRLAVLMGVDPGGLTRAFPDLEEAAPIPLGPDEIAVGIPADLLRRRPDIRRAERRIAAACARIGVEEAQLYPQLTLTGSIGLNALEARDWIDVDSRRYAYGPSLLWNLFSTGRIRTAVRAAEEIHFQALAGYEKTVLTALAEVRDALAAHAEEQHRRARLAEGVAAAERAVRLARARYLQGVSDFQHVLDAQRSLFTLQDQLATSDVTVTTGLIALFKALGGGWRLPGDGPRQHDP